MVARLILRVSFLASVGSKVDPGARAIMVLLMLLVIYLMTNLALASSWEVVGVYFVVRQLVYLS